MDRAQHEHPTSSRLLVWSGVAFAAGSGVHIVDHLRRGQGSITDELNWVGTTGIVLQAVIVTLIVTRHRSAPWFAALGGTALVAGFLAAHWLPHWSVLSDSYVDHNPGWFSIFASLAEIASGAAVAFAGYRLLLSRRGATRT